MNNRRINGPLARRLCASAAVIALSIAPTQGALAQSDTSADGDDSDVIVVTGSRIPRADVNSSSPVNIVDETDIRLSGSVLVEDILNELPQVAPEFTSTTNNGGAGYSSVDLRNLNASSGSPRTLVLVNGRRFMPVDEFNAIDINNIPSALIQRIEVVTGGASSVYGSDAVAGAVNFILQDNFEGLQLGGRYGMTDEGDGDTYNMNLTLGGNFADGRGNAVVFADFYRRTSVLAGARDHSAVARDDVGPPAGIIDLGSSRVIGGGAYGDGRATVGGLPAGILFADGTTGSSAGFAPDGTPINGAGSFNFQPDNYLQTPAERILLHGQGSYAIADWIEGFAEISYSNNLNEQQLAFDANDIPDAGPLFVPLTNPLIAANPTLVDFLRTNYDNGLAGDAVAGDDLASLPDFRRRMTEVGPRFEARELDTYRVMLGARGEFTLSPAGDPWGWEAYYSFARSNTSIVQDAYTSDIRIQQALFAELDPATMQPVCTNLDGGCVPIRLFGEGPTSISPEAAAFIAPTATEVTTAEQQVFNASVNGSAFELPAGPVGVAAGFEYRKETGAFRPDALLQSGELGPGSNTKPTSGSFDVWELFGETRVPLFGGLPFADLVEAEAAVRFADYSSIGSVVSFGGGGSWAVIDGFKFRGLYQRAIRAPNIGELFGGQAVASPTFADPCNAGQLANSAALAGVTEADIVAFCIAQGVPVPSIFQGDAQVSGVTQGNPNLSEERANTVTLGVVITPPSIPNFSLTFDYYDIKLNGAIDDVAATSVANLCITSLDLNNLFCQGITRNPGNGRIISLNQPKLNLGAERRQGFDWEMRYSFDIGEAVGGILSTTTLDFNHIGNYVLTYTTQATPDSAVDDCNGVFGGACSGLGIFASPKWKLINNVTANVGDAFSLRTQVRMVGNLDNIFASSISDLAAPNTGRRTYVDFAMTYDVNETIQLQAGGENLFDRDPPFMGFGFTGRGGGSDANTDPSLYDVLGRRFYLGAILKF